MNLHRYITFLLLLCVGCGTPSTETTSVPNDDVGLEDTHNAVLDASTSPDSAELDGDAPDSASEDTQVADTGVDLPNTPPDVQNARLAVVEGRAISIDLGALGFDAEGDHLEVQIVRDPLRGVLSSQGDGRWSYQAPNDYNGDDRFVFQLTDDNITWVEGRVELGVYAALDTEQAPIVLLPRRGLDPDEVAVVVNTNDPQSIEIGEYYVQTRGLPAENVVEVAIDSERLTQDGRVMAPEDFVPLREGLYAQTPATIQAYALAWTTPFRVSGESMTSAITLGYDEVYFNTSSEPCQVTQRAVTHNMTTTRPWSDLGVRPSMMLAGTSMEQVVALIDRGVAADNTFPTGTGYMVRTTDQARSPRASQFNTAQRRWENGGLDLRYIDNGNGEGSNLVTNADGVLFYMTGLTHVDQLDTNTYMAGAVADHLTSFGGILTGNSSQMSILSWLEAGVTASYGTVVEPCAFTDKFPSVNTLIPRYYRGATLLEAYWSSVAAPGEGIFVGEPLAQPWRRATIRFEQDALHITTTWLDTSSTYAIEGAAQHDGPWELVEEGITIAVWDQHTLTVSNPTYAFYRVVESEP